MDFQLAVDIVKACCIIYNFVRDRDGIQFQDTFSKLPSYKFRDTDISTNQTQEIDLMHIL